VRVHFTFNLFIMELECLQLYQDWVENIKQESTFFQHSKYP